VSSIECFTCPFELVVVCEMPIFVKNPARVMGRRRMGGCRIGAESLLSHSPVRLHFLALIDHFCATAVCHELERRRDAVMHASMRGHVKVCILGISSSEYPSTTGGDDERFPLRLWLIAGNDSEYHTPRSSIACARHDMPHTRRNISWPLTARPV
jgi:hypothetical protein